MSTVLVPVYSTGITLNEIPDKVAFFIELGNCKAGCKGCHSPHLHKPVRSMTLEDLCKLANQAVDIGANAIVIMGGTTNELSLDILHQLINALAEIAPVGLYSGSDDAVLNFKVGNSTNLTWLKTGSYQETKGGLLSPDTNQRFYKKEYEYVVDHSLVSTRPIWHDITERFYNEKTFRGSITG